MSIGGRGQARQRLLRRAGLIAGGLTLLALLFLISGHWVLAIIFAVPAVAAIWVYLQARSVR
jgi:uncharacterized membrane protein YccC